MAKQYRCAMEVRGYELDSFGHVNHAIYISYLEHARWKLLDEEKIGLADFENWKRWPVIGRIEVHYLKPSFMGDILDIHTRITENGKTYFIFEQSILCRDIEILTAKVRCIMVNEKGRPASLPPEIKRIWEDQDPGGGI